jgi:hypothetical protein
MNRVDKSPEEASVSEWVRLTGRSQSIFYRKIREGLLPVVRRELYNGREAYSTFAKREDVIWAFNLEVSKPNASRRS